MPKFVSQDNITRYHGNLKATLAAEADGTIRVHANNVITDGDHQFVSGNQLTNITEIINKYESGTLIDVEVINNIVTEITQKIESGDIQINTDSIINDITQKIESGNININMDNILNEYKGGVLNNIINEYLNGTLGGGGTGGITKIPFEVVQVPIEHSSWSFNSVDSLWEIDITHSLKTENLVLSVYDMNNKELSTIGVRILDKSTIKLRCLEKMSINVVMVSGEINVTPEPPITTDTKGILTYNTTVSTSDWTYIPDEGNYYKDITHNLNCEHVITHIIDSDTKDSLVVPSQVINPNSTKLIINEPKNVTISILSTKNVSSKEAGRPVGLLTYNTVVNSNEWLSEGKLFYKDISHNLNCEHVIVDMISITNKDDVLIATDIININTIRVYTNKKYDVSIAILSTINTDNSSIIYYNEQSEIQEMKSTIDGLKKEIALLKEELSKK